MSDSPRVFLDANVLFSASLGGPIFSTILELGAAGRIEVVTSAACVAEAAASLKRKRADALDGLLSVLVVVSVHRVRLEAERSWAESSLDETDVHLLAAARALGSVVLVTGDRAHFEPLMRRTELPLRVRTPRDFLLEGPPRAG